MSSLPRLRSRLRIAMGTFVAVEAEAADERTAEQGLVAAFEAITRIETLMHPDRPGSDLSQLAESRPGTVLRVDPWTRDVLQLCQDIHRISAGVFDPCLSLASGRMMDIELLEDLQVRTLAPVRVDLGGIAKGYAVDRAIDAMRAAGCAAGLVNAGGDLAVFGARSHTIYCHMTDGNTAAVALELANAALATSDTEHTSRPAEHRGYYHGKNRDIAISGKVSVVAPRAAVADALTKCLLGAGGVPTDALLEAFGARRVL